MQEKKERICQVTTIQATERKHPLAACERCPLQRNSCAPTTGPEGAKIAIVSRSPGYHDALNHKPFSGPSGKVLDYLLAQHGLKRENVLVTNVVLCQTDKPPKEAIEACRDRLETEVNAADTIIACGPEAAKALVGATSIHSARGFIHRRDNFSGRGQSVVVSANPAIVLRKSEAFPDLVRDFRRALSPPPIPKYPEVRYTENVEEGIRWIRNIDREASSGERVSADIESRGLAFNAPLVCLGLSRSGERAVVFGEPVVNDQSFSREVKYFLEREDISFVWHGGKFDTKILNHHGFNATCDQDTLLLSYVLDERPGTHSLEYLLMEHLAWGDYEPKSVKKFKREVMNAEKFGRDVHAVEYDPEEMYTYNGWDTAGTAQLYELLTPQLDADDRKHYEYLLRANEALRQVELNGIPYDLESAAELLEMEVRPTLAEMRQRLAKVVQDQSYNPNSSTQNSKLIHDDWKILIENRTIASRPDKERSVDKPVYLEIAAGRFDFPRTGSSDPALVAFKRSRAIEWAKEFRDFKELDKQRSTYIEGLIPRVVNGRIYASFKLHGTTSGRLSGDKPNLQNITRTKPGVPNIRKLFRATEGNVIIQADYSQAELRVIACLSQDPKLLEIYRKGDDLHSLVAERFYGAGFTKDQRDRAKNMDFGVAYGQSAETFQEKHEIPKEEAAEFIEWWWSEFKQVRVWRDAVHKQALTDNILISPFGRKKRIHLITKENKSEILRESVNWFPQSIAHDFTLYSLIGVSDRLDPTAGLVVNEVHDSLVLDVCNDYIDEVSQQVKEIMEMAPVESIGWKDIPFGVEIQTGPSWGEVK